MEQKIGILGTGIMGAGITRRLLSRGHKTVVWSRRREKTQPLVAASAEYAATPSELAKQCQTVLIVVRDDASTRDVVTGKDGSLATAAKGTLFINMSTVTPGFVVDALSATASRVCGLKKDKILARDWSTDFSLDLMCKDLRQAQETAERHQTDMPLMQAMRELYLRARNTSTADADFAIIADLAL
jgi:3-hydroxyisobutyrate dehydrogenase-like beta-hydroxyacid dehydrogenase